MQRSVEDEELLPMKLKQAFQAPKDTLKNFKEQTKKS